MTPRQWAKSVRTKQSGLRQQYLLAVNQKSATYLLAFFRRNFDRGGSVEDTVFVPWARRKYTLAKTTLVDTGYLRSEFRKSRVTYETVQIINPTHYGRFHNEGTRTLPRRPFLYESKRANARIVNLMTSELKKYLSK